jgi:hypothetical protein
MPGLHRAAKKSLKCPPILLSPEQAKLVCSRFRETAAYRQWRLYAIAVMANHFHVVVEAPAKTHSTHILRDLKSYASRALTNEYGKPLSGTWWTESGSRRPLGDELAPSAAMRYGRDQFRPLAMWLEEDSGG